MGKALVRLVAPFLLCAAAAGLTSAPAGALVPHAHSPSFVGSYVVYVTYGGTPEFHEAGLVVYADGTAIDQNRQVATWSNRGKTFKLVFRDGTLRQVFIAEQTRKGLASKRHPGSWANNGQPGGVWYAVKRA